MLTYHINSMISNNSSHVYGKNGQYEFVEDFLW